MAEQSTTSNRQNHAAASAQLQCCEVFGKPQCRRQHTEGDKCIEGRQRKSRAMTRYMRNWRTWSTVQDLGIQRGLGVLFTRIRSPFTRIGRPEQQSVKKDKPWRASTTQCLVPAEVQKHCSYQGGERGRVPPFPLQISYKKSEGFIFPKSLTASPYIPFNLGPAK